MNDRKVLPWYRHRWPWILMAGPALVIVAGIVTTWLAVKSSDGLVVDDYYKQGLTINRTLARAGQAQALGLEARLAFRDGRVEVHLSSRSGAALPPRLRLTFSHATRSGLDQAVLLSGAAGVYGGSLTGLPAGRWQVLLEDEEASWRLSGAAVLPAGGEVALGGAQP